MIPRRVPGRILAKSGVRGGFLSSEADLPVIEAPMSWKEATLPGAGELKGTAGYTVGALSSPEYC